jgi:predicted esterase
LTVAAPRLALWVLAFSLPAAPGSAAAGELRGVASTEASPLATASELARRLYSPTLRDRLDRHLSSNPQAISEQTVDVEQELFDLYVPETVPEGGYGVLVFVPPANEWPVPKDWRAALDRAGLIYVAPRQGGNDQDVFERRLPLALHALALVEERYPVQSQRRYISGFSGGGRVAMRLAVGYPDVFSGAMLMAGSDEIGTRGIVLPERALAERLIGESRFVFVTGGRDLPNRAKDGRVRENLEALCFRHVVRVDVPRLDHWIPPGRSLERALVELASAPGSENNSCMTALMTTIAWQLDASEARLVSGDAAGAGEALGRIDDLYGGLAAPRSVDLARRIAAALADER